LGKIKTRSSKIDKLSFNDGRTKKKLKRTEELKEKVTNGKFNLK